MQISSQEFHHLIRVLHCIDGWELPIDEDQLANFCRDPIRFFLACDDNTREVIWDAMLKRHERSYRGSRNDPLPDGVIAVSLEDPAELHNTLKRIFGE